MWIEDYNRLRASFIISSRVAVGFSLSTADTALFTLAFVNPSITRAVTASSVELLDVVGKIDVLSVPSPLHTLSFNSRIRR
jgi:hypothetical protein